MSARITKFEHRGYTIGPTLNADEPAWPLGWEQNPEIDDCPHEWEVVLLAADGRRRTRIEEVVRCSECHVPRCGHSADEDPCSLRRHHTGSHFPMSAVNRAIPPLVEDPIYRKFFMGKRAAPSSSTETREKRNE